MNTTQVKFNGCLELTKDSLSAGTELDKVDFLQALRTLIGRFGLETFFYMPLAGSMKFLISDSHHFVVDEVITEHNDPQSSIRISWNHTIGMFRRLSMYKAI